MQKILSKNSNWIKQLLLLILASNAPLLYGQSLCETKTIIGVFAYEQSPSLWSEDDMIYRRASLVMVHNDSINYADGIYVFEYGVAVPKECINKKNNKIIKYFSNSLNDSIHSFLEKCETLLINDNGGTYKLFDLELQVMLIGYYDIKVTNGNTFKDKSLPCYLVLGFDRINPILK